MTCPHSRSFLQDFHIYSIIISCLVQNNLWNIYHILCKILDILGDKKKMIAIQFLTLWSSESNRRKIRIVMLHIYYNIILYNIIIQHKTILNQIMVVI